MASFKINSAEFKHPITIERCQKVKDEDNILREDWIKFCSARAKILWTRGSEYTEAYATNSEVEAKNEVYDIIYVNNVQEANNYYEIKAKKVN